MTTKNKAVKTLHNNTEDIRSYGAKKSVFWVHL
jgi:hypothetical protein